MFTKKVYILFFVSMLYHSSSRLAENKKVTKHPNVIIIMADDHGWLDTGFNGNMEILTPNLDTLAEQGVIFDRFYSASPVSSPTRASLITGRNPERMNITDANVGYMLQEEITIPEILKQEGYATGHFGKWHLGTLTKTELDANRGGKPEFENEYSVPSQHGYDTYFSTESKVPTYDPMVMPVSFTEGEGKRFGWRAVEVDEQTKPYGTAYWLGENHAEAENLSGDDSRVIMDRVIPFIENATSENTPFFTTVWFHTPHLPVVSDSLHRSYYAGVGIEKQIYYGAITAMDEQVGRLSSKLKELGVAENTIVFYCSDNGPERETPGSAGVFRDRKRSLYEGGVRVPAFVVWANHFEPHKRIDVPFVTSDYLPTIVKLLGASYPQNRTLDGVDIFSYVENPTQKREKPIGFVYKSQQSWVNQQYKLISLDNGIHFELYDLINDKAEHQNIIEKYPSVAAKMKDELAAWIKSVEQSKNGEDYNLK